MKRPQVADGGDGLQIWRATANTRILNKQSRIADKGWSPDWGLGERLTTLHSKKKKKCYEVLQWVLYLTNGELL
jgi:hypothetical protein